MERPSRFADGATVEGCVLEVFHLSLVKWLIKHGAPINAGIGYDEADYVHVNILYLG